MGPCVKTWEILKGKLDWLDFIRVCKYLQVKQI